MTEQQQHPITPPPELVNQWRAELPSGFYDGYKFPQRETELCIQAARWGADQELEACCHLLRQQGFDVVEDLCAARRPKPPILKQQALEMLNKHEDGWAPSPKEWDTIRRALEQLDD